jgi:hypothetical protein
MGGSEYRPPHGWDERNANVLTDDENLDPITGFPAFRRLLARIVKKDRVDSIHKISQDALP